MCAIDLLGLAAVMLLQPLMAVLWVFVVGYVAMKVAGRKSGAWLDERLREARRQAEELK